MSFQARYKGQCAACEEDITPGQTVVHSTFSGLLIHEVCPEVLPAKPASSVCVRCFCYHAGECL
jgi:hypothetical protein